jgi:hypothetical protein
VPNLWSLRDAVVSFTLRFSIFRMRNALPRLSPNLTLRQTEPALCSFGSDLRKVRPIFNLLQLHDVCKIPICATNRSMHCTSMADLRRVAAVVLAGRHAQRAGTPTRFCALNVPREERARAWFPLFSSSAGFVPEPDYSTPRAQYLAQTASIPYRDVSIIAEFWGIAGRSKTWTTRRFPSRNTIRCMASSPIPSSSRSS